MEIVYTSACEAPFRLLDWALTRAQHLGTRPDGRVLNHVFDSFPDPQICIHPPLRADFVTLPVEVSPGVVCTVTAPRDFSAIQLMIQLEQDCSVTRMQRLLLTHGKIKLKVNGIAIDDVFQKDALILADTAVVTPHYVLLGHGVAPDAELIAPHWRNAVGPFVVHRPSVAPIEVDLPASLSPSGVRHSLIAAGLIDNAASLHTPYVCPVIPGIGLHLLALDRAQAIEHGGAPWLTVIAFPRNPSPSTPVLEPALTASDELPRLRPGYRATYAQHRRYRSTTATTTHAQVLAPDSSTTTTTGVVPQAPASVQDLGCSGPHVSVPVRLVFSLPGMAPRARLWNQGRNLAQVLWPLIAQFASHLPREAIYRLLLAAVSTEAMMVYQKSCSPSSIPKSSTRRCGFGTSLIASPFASQQFQACPSPKLWHPATGTAGLQTRGSMESGRQTSRHVAMV